MTAALPLAPAARPFFLHLPGGEPTDFEVQRFEVSERLHAPWTSTVELALRPSMNLDPAQLVGQTGRLEITSPVGATRSFVGVITAVERGRFVAGYHAGRGDDAGPLRAADELLAAVAQGANVNDGMPTFRVQIASPLSKAGLVQDFRIFENKPLLDIARAILAPYAVELDASALKKSYATPLPLRVAYRETHLAFLQRLLARAGITFSCETTGAGETLRLYDDAPDPEDGSFVPYVARDGLVAEGEQVFSLTRTTEVHPAAVALRGFHFLRPTQPQEGRAGAPRTVNQAGQPGQAGSESGELYDLDPQLQRDGQGAPMSRHRLEALHWPGHLTFGQSTCSGLVPGHPCTVTPSLTSPLSALESFEGAYQVVSVVHRGINPSWATNAESEEPVYANAFVAVPVAVICRPPIPAGPRIAGIQTAKVVGPAGEEIHTDQHGRVRLKFPWDRSPPADDTTEGCWVRVGSSWSGEAWGALRLPRLGHEVVVHFEQGDPECPVVLGSVYNGRNNPPVTLPDAKTESVLRSASSLGSDGFHEIRFDDAKGVERFAVHAERDHAIEVLRDRRQAVHADEDTDVIRHRTRIVDQDQSLKVAQADSGDITGNSVLAVHQFLEQTSAEHTTSVLGQRRLAVTMSRELAVAGQWTRSVATALSSTVTGGVEAYLDGASFTELDKNAKRSYQGSVERTVTHRHELTLGKSDGKVNLKTAGDLDANVRGRLERVALGPLTEEVGADWSLTVDEGIVFTSKETRIEAETLTIRVGEKARLSISKSGEIALHGAKVFIDGKKTTLKGSKTNKLSGAGISNPQSENEKEKKTEPFDYEIGVHMRSDAPVTGTYRLVSVDSKATFVASKKEERPNLALLVFKKVDPSLTYSLFHEDGGHTETIFEALSGQVLAATRRKRQPKLKPVAVEVADLLPEEPLPPSAPEVLLNSSLQDSEGDS